MSTATGLVEALAAASPPLPTSLEALDGEWELVFTDVAHGIFRSSPFFLAIQQAYAVEGVPEKAELFFKLHELQTYGRQPGWNARVRGTSTDGTALDSLRDQVLVGRKQDRAGGADDRLGQGHVVLRV